ncbi:MAG: methyl-accepting chemotaxis protein, partial [Spirochaetales bacterium]|nr:methyl-accepting chemotaxis protein [Spirochaetales bacterium]
LPTDDDIRVYIADVYDIYFGEYEQIRTLMFQASDAAEPYPLDFDDFFRVSTDALQTAVALSVAAGERTLTILNRRQIRAAVLLAVYALLLLVSISLCAGQIRYTSRRISDRLTGLAGQMEVLASGDTAIDPSQYRARDEIGRMAEALVTFRHNAVEKIDLEAQQREDAERAIRQREATVRQLAERIERQTRSSIEAVAAKSDQLNDAARAMRDRLASMVESSSTVAHVAATTRESSDKARASVDDFNRALERINGELGHSKEAIDGASETVSQAGRAVSELSTRAESVAEVVRSIETVAEKTHLLSLNAAIEAARAGHSGRGFAVVAGEVKSLAASTGQFTQRIFGQIDDMRDANEHVVRMMHEIAEGMQRVDSRSQEIFSTIEAQSAGTEAINQVLVENLRQAGLSAERVHELADAAEELRSLAGGLEELAYDLDEQVSQIRGTINGLTDGSSDESTKEEPTHLVDVG